MNGVDKLIATITLLTIFSCNDITKTFKIPIEKEVEIVDSNYLLNKTVNKVAKDTLVYHFSNNPYGWTKNDDVILYINDSITFIGKYGTCLKGLYNKDGIPEKVNFRLFVVKNQKLYIYQNKYLINWEEHFAHVYICLFPENQNTERIFFFPQAEPLL